MARTQAARESGVDSRSPPHFTSRERELLQLISEGFVFVDREFRIREINAVGLKMARRPRSDYLGRSLWDVVPQGEDSSLGRKWIRAMRDRTPVSEEQLYTWSDGRQSWLEIRGHPTEGGLAIFYRDVTRSKQSEEALKRTQAELLHASRLSAMGTMAATLAHELAQPLTTANNAIGASLNMLRAFPSPEIREARRPLHLARSSVRRSGEILKRVRAFVLKRPVETAIQDLRSIIADAVSLVSPEARQSGVAIGLDLDPEARWIRADAIQIQQVLINLMKNAIEAMAGSVAKTLTVATADLSPDEVEIRVEDSGPGLKSTSPNELFVPFQTSKPHGMGLGLSISKTIVQAHGGKLRAARSKAGGACFHFTLPRARAEQALGHQ